MNNKLYLAVIVSALLSSTALASNSKTNETKINDVAAAKAQESKAAEHSKELKALKAKIAALDKKVNADNKAASDSVFNLNSEKLKIGLDTEFQAGRNFKANTGKSGSAYINKARVTLKGRLAPEWGYNFSVDFADEDIDTKTTTLELDGQPLLDPNNNNQPLAFDYAPDVQRKTAIKDANIQFYGFHPVIIAVGRMFPDMTIDRGEMFLENPAVAGLLPVNRNGFYISTHGDMWYVSSTLTHSGSNSTSDSHKVNTTWYRKLAVAPINNKENVFHLGGSWVTKFPKTNQYSTSDFNQRPENALGSILVGAGYLDNIKKTDTWMVDAAYGHGPLLVAAEYVRTDVKRNTVKNSKFDGWYAQVSYALTGETRAYDMACPSFSDIEPAKPFDLAHKQFGAFEVKYRFSTVNYGKSDYSGKFVGLANLVNYSKPGFLPLNGNVLTLNGGKMTMHTVGFNWFPNNNLVLMIDYSFGQVKNSELWGNFYYLDKNSDATTVQKTYSPKILIFKAKVRI